MPVDKCEKCNWNWDNLNATEDMIKGHCYMFKNKMKHCGQYCPVPRDKSQKMYEIR